jgi:hypothetical protein
LHLWGVGLTLKPMNTILPIALLESRGASARALQGARATDPVRPTSPRAAGRPAPATESKRRTTLRPTPAGAC